MSLRLRFLILYFLLAGMGIYMGFHRDLVVPLAKPFGEFPPSYGEWRMVGQSSLSDNVFSILMPTDYLSRRYASSDGSVVDMYLSFFDGGPDSGRVHSPKNCVAGSGWTELLSERIIMNIADEQVNLVRSVYAKGEIREVIYYWFAMRGKTMSDEYSLKIAEITGSILHNRRDQSFIRISAQTREATDDAEKSVEDFLQEFYPKIREYLPS